jgi:thioredoxin-dependent peroxiredoxin
MATFLMGDNTIHTNSNLPEIGNKAPEFYLSKTDLSEVKLETYNGHRLILNIFPSIDTGVCATSVRKFNELAAGLPNTKVLCVSRDLPFAQKRFCGAEGIDNVELLSDFKTGSFGVNYGVLIEDGPFAGLHARSIVVLNETGHVLHTELVPSIGQEPNYDAAIAAIA